MKTKGIVENDLFVAHMRELWENELKNHTNPALEFNWRRLGHVFQKHIQGSPDWDILPLPTGTGKTEGTCLYSALLGKYLDHEHPGVLIITYQIEGADYIADRINQLAEQRGIRKTAFAYHSGLRPEVSQAAILSDYPVLVITHQAYQNAMEGRPHSKLLHDAMSEYLAFSGEERKLIVIDEHLDIVDHVEVTDGSIHYALGFISDHLQDHLLIEHEVAIDFVREISSKLSVLFKEGRKERILEDVVGELGLEKTVNLDGLIYDLKKCGPKRGFRSHYTQNKFKTNKTSTLAQLRGLQWIMDTWVYYSQNNLNTAHLLLPPALMKGCVVLDATAGTNKVYTVFDKATVQKVVEGARLYNNVTLYVVRDCKVGKSTLCSEAEKEKHTESFLREIKPLIKEGSKAAVMTHMGIAENLQAKLGDTAQVGYWGKDNTGTNQWKDYDTLFFYGLFYPPKPWAANTFMAYQDVQSDEWLHDEDYREFKGHRDIKLALEAGKFSTDIIQAINRIRCRKTIDSEGNCDPCSIYLPLMEGPKADIIIADIKKNMPGIIIVEWNPEFTFRKKPKQNPHQAHYSKDKAIGDVLKQLSEGDSVTMNELEGKSKASMSTLIRFFRKHSPEQLLKLYGIVRRKEPRLTNRGEQKVVVYTKEQNSVIC